MRSELLISSKGQGTSTSTLFFKMETIDQIQLDEIITSQCVDKKEDTEEEQCGIDKPSKTKKFTVPSSNESEEDENEFTKMMMRNFIAQMKSMK